MNVTFRQLRVFAEVARLASVQRAAEALHLTPPAVSMQIKELENQVGLALFDRTGRRLSLSTSGEYFLVYARRLLGGGAFVPVQRVGDARAVAGSCHAVDASELLRPVERHAADVLPHALRRRAPSLARKLGSAAGRVNSF